MFKIICFKLLSQTRNDHGQNLRLLLVVQAKKKLFQGLLPYKEHSSMMRTMVVAEEERQDTQDDDLLMRIVPS